jgi:hypothetical protein
MVASAIVWDIETVPDIKSFAAANGHDGKSESCSRPDASVCIGCRGPMRSWTRCSSAAGARSPQAHCGRFLRARQGDSRRRERLRRFLPPSVSTGKQRLLLPRPARRLEPRAAESMARARPTVFVEKRSFQEPSRYRRCLHQRYVTHSALYTLQPLLNPRIF